MDERNADTRNQAKSRKILGLCVLVVIVIYFLMTSGGPKTSVDYDNVSETLTLSYSDSDSEYTPITIKVADIVSVNVKESIDLGTMVSGTENKSYSFGVWHNDEFGDYELCITNKIDSYVVTETPDGYVVFNFESDDTTQAMADEIVKLSGEVNSDAAGQS